MTVFEYEVKKTLLLTFLYSIGSTLCAITDIKSATIPMLEEEITRCHNALQMVLEIREFLKDNKDPSGGILSKELAKEADQMDKVASDTISMCNDLIVMKGDRDRYDKVLSCMKVMLEMTNNSIGALKALNNAMEEFNTDPTREGYNKISLLNANLKMVDEIRMNYYREHKLYCTMAVIPTSKKRMDDTDRALDAYRRLIED